MHCFRNCISIMHSNDYNKDNAHIHTVEIAIYVEYMKDDNGFVIFNDVESIINNCYSQYNEKYLNDLEGFEENVTIEHLGEKIFEKIEGELKMNNIFLRRFEISETPLRIYIISYEL